MLSKNKFLLFFLAFLVVSIALGYYFYNKAPQSIQGSEAITIGSAQLYDLYRTDSAGAQQRFSGKVLSVTGGVVKIDKNQQGETVVSLATGLPGAYVNCSMDALAITLHEGQKATVKGFCSGIGQGDEDLGIKPDVYLIRSILVE